MERLLAPLESIGDNRRWVRALIDAYLDDVAAPDLASVCSLSLVLPDVARSATALRSAFSERTAALLDRVAPRFAAIGGLPPREAAIAVFATLAGAVALARTIPAPHARARIRRATEAMLTAALWPDETSTA